MSSGNDSTTTQVKPPKYAQPYIKGALNQARNLYQQGGPQQYQGNTVVPFSPDAEQAFQMIRDRATNGSEVGNAAQDLATRTLNGDFLNSNPFLDAMYQRAAGQSQLALSSQFGGYGRDVSAQLPFRQQQLNDLATTMYGQNYENERNRQMGMMPYVDSLAGMDYKDAAMLRGVGSEIEGKTGEIIQDNVSRWNFDQNRPYNNLNNYIGNIGGLTFGQSQTSTAPSGSTAGNVLGGAAMGAGMGLGPWGAIGGGLLGLFA